MAKKEIRVIVAAADVAGIVDHGFDVDAQIKNLNYEDKGIKAKLAQMVEGDIQSSETSIRLRGDRAAAVVTRSESVKLNVGAESFPDVRRAVDVGLLEGFVERKLSLVVPPADVARAAEALRAAGIMASVAENLSVEAESLRNREAASVTQGEAVRALKACVEIDTSWRVKYEKV